MKKALTLVSFALLTACAADTGAELETDAFASPAVDAESPPTDAKLVASDALLGPALNPAIDLPEHGSINVGANIQALISGQSRFVNSNNEASMASYSPTTTLRAIAMIMGPTTDHNYWTCSPDGTRNSNCLHPTSATTNDVLWVHDCTSFTPAPYPYTKCFRCTMGVNFSTAGSMDTCGSSTGPWACAGIWNNSNLFSGTRDGSTGALVGIGPKP
jgi:hypothetical protein